MEWYHLAIGGLGTALLLTLSLWLRTASGRRRVRAEAAGLMRDMTAVTQSAESLRLGEREAAWAATATTRRLEQAVVDLDKVTHQVIALEADLDEMRTHLSEANRDLDRSRAEAARATAQVTALEIDLERSRQDAADSQARLAGFVGLEQRLATVIRERDRLSATAIRGEQMESELAALGTIHRELEAARTEAETLRSQLTGDERRGSVDDRLIAAAATRASLEERLQAVTAARQAEQREAATRSAELDRLRRDIALREEELARLRDQPAEAPPATTDASDEPADAGPSYSTLSREFNARTEHAVEQATDRLRREVEHLRSVVVEKERLISRLTARAAPAPSATITDIKGIGPKIAAILAEHGITTLRQVAELDADAIERLGPLMPVYPERIRDDDWVGQAQGLLG